MNIDIEEKIKKYRQSKGVRTSFSETVEEKRKKLRDLTD